MNLQSDKERKKTNQGSMQHQSKGVAGDFRALMGPILIGEVKKHPSQK